MIRPMPFSGAVLAGLCTAALSAGEPALRITIHDVPGLGRSLSGGVFGEAWRESVVVAWRHALLSESGQAWSTVLDGATQARVELVLGGSYGGNALVGLTAAALAPGVAVPPVAAGIRTRRADAWVVGSSAGGELREPPMSERLGMVGDPVVADAEIRLGAWLDLLSPDQQTTVKRLLDTTGLTRGTVAIQSGGAGLSERSVWPGAKLPLRTADPGVLAGLPGTPLLLVVAGVDGPTAAALAGTVLDEDPQLGPTIAETVGVSMAEVAAACDGTAFVAILPGQPLPTWLVSLPRSAAIDAVLVARVTAQAPDAVDEVLAALDQQPVALTVDGLGTAMVQRSAQRLLLGGTAGVVAAMAASAGEEQVPYPTEQLWPTLPPEAVAMAYADLAAVAQWSSPVVPEQVRAAMAAAARHLPAASLVLTMDKDGAELRGRNGLGLLLPAVALLPVVGPGLAESYERACHAAAKSTIARISERSRAFAAATSGHWPRDLDDLRAWAKSLSPQAIGQAGRPDIVEPFCYVQPRVAPPADQPVIVQDPALNRGAGSLVGFAGGEVRFIPGDLYWREARRLAALPETRSEGVAPAQWATMPRTF
jgi:hypothetical protein